MTELVQSVRLKYEGKEVASEAAGTKAALADIAAEARKVGPASAGIAEIGTAARTAAGGAQAAADAVREVAQAAGGVRPAADAIGAIAGEATAAATALGTTAAATREVAQAAAGVSGGAGLRDVGAMAEAAGIDLAHLTARVRELEAELGDSRTAAAGSASGMAALTRSLEEAEKQAGDLGRRVEELEGKLAGNARGNAQAKDSAGLLQFAYRDLGFQIQDVGAQLATSGGDFKSLTRIFGQQAGQIFSALGLIAQASGQASQGVKDTGAATGGAGVAIDGLGEKVGGVAEKVAGTTSRFAKFAGFISGPWGAALTVGVTLLAPMIAKLFEADNATEELRKGLDAAAQSADSFGNAQALLGRVMDLTTGKFKTHNAVLIETIRLQAEAARQQGQDDERKARDGLKGAGELGVGGTIGTFLSRVGNANPFTRVQQAQAGGAPLRGLRDQVLSGDLTDATEIRKRIDVMREAGQLAGYTAEQVSKLKLQFLALPKSLNDQKAAEQSIAALDGKGVAADLVPYEREKKKRVKKPADTDDLVASVKNDIASLTADFSDAPTFVEKARAAIAKLDQDAAKLEKRKPPSYQSLIEQVRVAQGLIRDNLDKPFADFLRSQQESYDVSRLLADGHVDEANALRVVQQLQRQMGPLTDQQKQSVLGVVQATRALGEQQQANEEHLRKYHQAIDDIRGALQGAFSGGVKGVADLPKQLVSAFSRLKSEEIFDRLFDGAFRELQEQIDGTSTVKDAGERMADAIGTTLDPLNRLATAAANAAAGVSGRGGVTGGGAAQVLDGAGNVVGSFAAPAAPSLGEDAGDITVNANRTHNATGLFQESITKLAKGVGISDEAASTIGRKAGIGIEGAAKGALVASVFNPIAKGLGLETSKFGAQAGGALGALTGIPGGDIIGSVAGSLLGGLLKTQKKGSATIGNVAGEAAITGTSGNSAAYIKEATGAAGGVVDAIDSIVQQLGGTLGDFSVSIGKSKKKYRVDTSGQGRTTAGKANDGVTGYDTIEEAQAAALADAIADGAIAGVSAAVQRALQSSDDANKAIREALKVQSIEDIMTGLGADLVSSFRSFEQQAKQRVETARKYGFDVEKIEAYNAEQRAALVDSTTRASVGSLQNLLESLATGDLSEGDAAAKRDALLGKITTARADVAAGKSGAGDTLAGYLQTLVESDRESFGTAGPEYAASRELAKTAAEEAVRSETDRIAAAQKATDATNAALATANTLADENNDQNAQMIALLKQIAASRGGSGGSAAVTLDLNLVRRLV